MTLIYLIVSFLLFLLTLYIAKWIFRIDDIVDQLQRQNAMLIRMLKRNGASNQEIRDSLETRLNIKEVLKD